MVDTGFAHSVSKIDPRPFKMMTSLNRGHSPTDLLPTAIEWNDDVKKSGGVIQQPLNPMASLHSLFKRAEAVDYGGADDVSSFGGRSGLIFCSCSWQMRMAMVGTAVSTVGLLVVMLWPMV